MASPVAKPGTASPQPLLVPQHPRLKRARKLIRNLAVVALLLLFGAVVFGTWFVRRPWPETSGTLKTAGLHARVEILRDRWGTPHIYAQNLHDLFFSQGYVQAQDRLWQMEFTRRVGNGQLSSFLGPDTLGIDRFMRTIGLRRTAERDWSHISGEERELMQAYSDGVNAYIDGHRGRLALEFNLFHIKPARWTPQDILVTVGLMSWILSENASFELSRAHFISQAGDAATKQLLPPFSDGVPFIVPEGADHYSALKNLPKESSRLLNALIGTPGPSVGSNSWAVSGSRTATGAPMLANDTHLDLFMPSSWYATGLHAGNFDAVGYSFTGTPGIVIGHNQNIAWGITDLVGDVEDFYIEKLDQSEHAHHYLFRNNWRDLDTVTETIEVKGGSPVQLGVQRTHHGPLVSNLGGRFKYPQPLALAWSGDQCETAIAAVIALNRAANYEQFRAALSLWDGPDLNFVYADQQGNIGSQAVGRIPVRSDKHQGSIPVPGWTGEYEWKGYVPALKLPNSFNPSAGFIVAANQKAVSDSYPYRLGYEWADPFRAIRISDLLSAKDHVSVDDMKQIQGDNYDLPAKDLLPYLQAVQPTNDVERKALSRLRSWNLYCSVDDSAPSIFQTWYRFLVQDTVGDELGPKLTEEYMEYYWVHMPVMLKLTKQQNNPLFDDIHTPQVEDRNAIVQRSFHDAVEWLSKRYGNDPDNWKWGRLHTLTFRHRPLGLAEVPVLSKLFSYGPMPDPACDRFTVNAAWFTTDDTEHPFNAVAGTSQRIIMQTQSWDSTLAVNSTGQSEHLFHPHRDDETQMWAKLQYHPLSFTRKAVEATLAGTLELVPAESNIQSPAQTPGTNHQ